GERVGGAGQPDAVAAPAERVTSQLGDDLAAACRAPGPGPAHQPVGDLIARGEPRDAHAPIPALLPVPLHLADRPRLRLLRVLAELPAGAALAQQVPALVERLLGRGQPGMLLRAGDLTGRELGAQLVLGLDEIVDVGQDLLIVHGSTVSLARASSAAP